MLINLKKWSDNDIPNQVLNYISNKPLYQKFEDQDLLNFVISNDIIFLEIKFNFFDQYLLSKVKVFKELRKRPDTQTAIENPVIIHFTHGKPTDPICLNYYIQVFNKYFQTTPWFIKNDDRYSVKTRMKIAFLKFLTYETRTAILCWNYSFIKTIIIVIVGIRNAERLLRIKEYLTPSK